MSEQAWLLWGSREGYDLKLFGIYADRETALAAQDVASELPRADDWADIFVTPWPIRTEPTLRALAKWDLARQREIGQKLGETER